MKANAVPRFELRKKKRTCKLAEEATITQPQIYADEKYISVMAHTKDGSLISVRVPCTKEPAITSDLNLLPQPLEVETRHVNTDEQIVTEDRDILTEASNETNIQPLTTDSTKKNEDSENLLCYINSDTLLQPNVRYFIHFCTQSIAIFIFFITYIT